MHQLCCLTPSISFNADKTQLIKFYRYSNPVSALPCFIFLGQTLSLSNSIILATYITIYPICAISKDMCHKANCLLHIFSCCDPFVNTSLFSSFCLSLYGAALWRSSSPQLRALKVSFNNILRKIWSLPHYIATLVLFTLSQDSRVFITRLLLVPEIFLHQLEDPILL